MTDVDLNSIKETYLETRNKIKRRIVVCAETGCLAHGSLDVFNKLVEETAEKGLDVTVSLDYEEKPEKDILFTKSGCQGFCQAGPLVTIYPDDIMYHRVKVKDVPEIVEKTIVGNDLVKRLLHKDTATKKRCRGVEEIPFYTQQVRILLEPCGSRDPKNINEYISNNGYVAGEKALQKMTPKEICDVVTDSGLRGRGGGGFPAGKKWTLALKQTSKTKYIICNGDEGDPGAFMDRSILEGNPHSVLEGMVIAAKGMGATAGYVYVRTEYPLAVKSIKKAIADAKALGCLGDNMFGSGFSFDIHVMEGAGAFVCGEASAMVESIMGNRGIPRAKPPRTAEKGLWLKPTVVNNVETLSSVPFILLNGAQEYRKNGTEGSSGTKTFALTGHVANSGLIEVPFGTTLRKIVFEIGGGILNRTNKVDNNSFKAVQIGGPSGGCLTKKHLDLPLDFDSLKSIGAMVGSGGLVAMNDDTCMVQIAKFFMKFTQHESCGKCTPCREGTNKILGLLEEVIAGRGTLESLDMLKSLCKAVISSSLCGLGKSAPSPVLSTLNEFMSEYEAHVIDKFCPAGKCADLFELWIDPELCKGCILCTKVCPTAAISGEKKKPHSIVQQDCTKCGSCRSQCKFNAIEVVKIGTRE